MTLDVYRGRKTTMQQQQQQQQQEINWDKKQTRKQLLFSGEMRKVENNIVLDGLSTNMRRIVIPFLFLYLP